MLATSEWEEQVRPGRKYWVMGAAPVSVPWSPPSVVAGGRHLHQGGEASGLQVDTGRWRAGVAKGVATSQG